MPSYPPTYTAGVVQLRVRYGDTASRVHENVMWVEGSGSPGYTLPALNNLAGIVAGDFSAMWAPLASPAAYLINVLAQDWSSSTGLQGSSITLNTAGTGTGTIGTDTAVLISLHEGLRYKGGHGRIYLPGLAQSTTTDGITMVTGKHTAAQTAMNSFMSDLQGITMPNGGPFKLIVFHQRRKAVPPATGWQPPSIQIAASSVVQTMLATQRRRLRKAPHH